MNELAFLDQQLSNYLLMAEAKIEFERLVHEQLEEVFKKHFAGSAKKLKRSTYKVKNEAATEISVWAPVTDKDLSEIDWISFKVYWNDKYMSGKPFAYIALHFKNKNKFNLFMDEMEDILKGNVNNENYEYETYESSVAGVVISDQADKSLKIESSFSSITSQIDYIMSKVKEDFNEFREYLKIK